MVEAEDQRRGALARSPVADGDAEDRLRLGRERLPEPERREESLRGERERVGAAVEAARNTDGGRLRLHHDDAEPGRGEGEGEGRAVEPAARDEDVRVAHRP